MAPEQETLQSLPTPGGGNQVGGGTRQHLKGNLRRKPLLPGAASCHSHGSRAILFVLQDHRKLRKVGLRDPKHERFP